MKPFNLEEAIAGKPIKLRNGSPAKFIAYVPELPENAQVLACIQSQYKRSYDVAYRYPDGGLLNGRKDLLDLVMDTERTVWVNFYDAAGYERTRQEQVLEGGMTLLDKFAGDAIQGICASGPDIHWSSEMLAKEAYSIAAAMIEARKEYVK